MDALAGDPVAYTALEDSYKEALRRWSDVRALYPSQAPEVLEVVRRVEAIERQLRALRPHALVKYQPPPATRS